MTLPVGTVTFLFTDIEGSTRLMQELGDRYPQLQADHHEMLRAAFRRHDGRELRTEGDSFFCVFASALAACSAAGAVQRSFTEHTWPDSAAIRVRVGLHTGEAPLMGNEYVGLDVHHAARIAGAAHGGQVLVSEATRSLVESSLPPGLTMRDLGLHRLRDMARPESLYQLVIEGVPDAFPALRTLDGTPNNLPTQLTSFIGRSAMVGDAKRLLQTSRLLTLTGQGGIGKTRLSLQVAAEMVDQFPGGVYFVPLSAVRDPELVSSAVAQVLGIPLTGSRLPFDGVVDYLRDKEVLLVMDNFEQLLPAAAGVPSELLQSSPGLKVIVSSRSPLHAYGEQEFGVQPLLLPDLKALPSLEALSQYEAVKLFIERALAVKPDFRATNQNAPAIAGICERVDGLPLAIELAAARVKLFSPQALLVRLEKSLRVLGSGAHDLPARQQTLEAAIAWSYEMLDEPGKRLMARFSVFARGAGLEQAENICGPSEEIGVDVLEGLDDLADHSLLRRMPDSEEPRILMLQTIREFASERLEQIGEAELMRDRHAAAFQALAEAVEPGLFSDQQKELLERLERDHDNFRAALDWCVARGNAERAMSLAASLWRFWQMRGRLHEARARLQTILALSGSHDHPQARRRALEAAGGVAYWQGDLPAAEAWYDESLELARAAGSREEIANAIYNAAFPRLIDKRDLLAAHTLLEEALPLFREFADDAGVARCFFGIGSCLNFEENYADAVAPLDEAIRLFRDVGDRFGLGWALHTRALVAMKLQDVATARPLVREAMSLFSATGDVSGIVLLLDDSGQIARLEGDPVRATRLAAAATALQASSGAGLGAVLTGIVGSIAREGLSEAAGERAWAEGRALSTEQAVAYALGDGPARPDGSTPEAATEM